MKRLPRNKVLLVLAAGLVVSWPTAAQVSHYTADNGIPPPAKKAARLHITEGPALERFRDNEAIIRWTSNNLAARTSASRS
jgi:hypothetical protein